MDIDNSPEAVLARLLAKEPAGNFKSNGRKLVRVGNEPNLGTSETDDLFGTSPSGAIGALKALSAAAPEVDPKAKQAADALQGKAPVADTGEPLPPGTFKKGFLKGVDKTIFIAMMADTLSNIGSRKVDAFGNPVPGATNTGFTRQAIEGRDERMRLREQQKEREVARQEQRDRFDETITLEREKLSQAKDESGLERENRSKMQLAAIKAEGDMYDRRVEVEIESKRLLSERGVAARDVADILDGSSGFEGLRLRPEHTAENMLADPAIREEVRRLVSPFKNELILKRIERANGAKAAEKQGLLVAELARNKALWVQGKKFASALDVDRQLAANVGDVITVEKPLGERIRLSIAGLEPFEIMNDKEMAKNKGELFLQLQAEFVMIGKGEHFNLDEEFQLKRTNDLFGQVDALFDKFQKDARKIVREQTVDGKLPGAFDPVPEKLTEQERLVLESQGKLGRRSPF